MSLLDIAKSIKKDGFDPRKDSVNGQSPIPAGTYPVVLKKATFNVSESGWESLGYQFEVRGGDYDGRTDFVTFPTLDTWKNQKGEIINLDWKVKQTIKFFQKVIVLAGDQTWEKDFEDGKSMEEALQRKAVGSYFNLIIDEGVSKKGKEYRNYDIEEEANQPIMSATEIDDDDLPF
ncbi:hypothetical protein [Streptococcus lutetiensis]|uniref:hypothetical protein n=1 Tax=Streptococcus lutetiensis TaxID=150055 RepID=UPI001BDAF9DE|nr:hypothetical protein [Streptococcus lutetiensis]MBT0938942.1 hypothetical protein [Streptococcus lutetiensis]MBT0945572.1 hypothetical protein [Streptococcus lutetiensis]